VVGLQVIFDSEGQLVFLELLVRVIVLLAVPLEDLAAVWLEDLLEAELALLSLVGDAEVEGHVLAGLFGVLDASLFRLLRQAQRLFRAGVRLLAARSLFLCHRALNRIVHFKTCFFYLHEWPLVHVALRVLKPVLREVYPRALRRLLHFFRPDFHLYYLKLLNFNSPHLTSQAHLGPPLSARFHPLFSLQSAALISPQLYSPSFQMRSRALETISFLPLEESRLSSR